MFKKLQKVFERWCERESIRTDGKACNFLPDLTYRWGMNKISGFFIVAEGYCLERSTAPHKEHPELDEFGVAFRLLPEIAQAVMIVAHFGKRDEWRAFLADKRLKPKVASRILRVAWMQMWVECHRREII